MFSVILSPAHVKEFWEILRLDPSNTEQEAQNIDEWISAARRGEKEISGARIVIQDSVGNKGNYAAYLAWKMRRSGK